MGVGSWPSMQTGVVFAFIFLGDSSLVVPPRLPPTSAFRYTSVLNPDVVENAYRVICVRNSCGGGMLIVRLLP